MQKKDDDVEGRVQRSNTMRAFMPAIADSS